MNKQILTFLVSALAMSPSFAKESIGEQLVNDSCQRCHDNSMYTRPNSIIHSFPALQDRVEFCDSAANTHWQEAQRNKVVEYLNDTFYKFDK